MMKDAHFYTQKNDILRCCLCPHNCLIDEDCFGICRNRKNIGGKLQATGYAQVSSLCFDPIEKKPLYHFYPFSTILSVGGLWCNLKCSFCQNWRIAHKEAETISISPEKLCDMALLNGSIGIAFTYNEPFIWYEYVYDVSVLARKSNLKILLVTNGYINLKPLKNLLPFVDAMNIDVKGFRNDYYRDICGGELDYVKNTVEESAKHCHVEITTLIVNGLNDKVEELRDMLKWLESVNPLIPLHISRYYPEYKMRIPETPTKTLYELRKIASEYLSFVYIGNVLDAQNNTYCPRCSHLIVDRTLNRKVVNATGGLCNVCGFKIFVC